MLPALKPDTTTKATEAQVLQALASLAGLPARQADDDGIDKSMYFVALEGVTRYGLSEAIKSIIRGGMGHTFFPSPVELRRECDKAMEPHYRQAARIRLTEQQAYENAEYDRIRASRTPESLARSKAVYDAFCAAHASERQKDEHPVLDPALVALIPDADDYPKDGAGYFRSAKVA